MPRYCAEIIALPLPHHHGRPRAGHRPAEIGRDLGILDLTATALAIIVGMLPLAIRSDRATIVGIVAKLPHILDHHGDAVGIALAEMAAGRVVRPLAAEH